MESTAKQLAEIVLNEVWGDKELPIDPVWIARKLGIKVIEMKLPENVSGALIKKQGEDPVIVICETDSPNRKRFSCAHELGHYISRNLSEENNDGYEYVDLRGDLASQGTNKEEKFANEFAACLLMPEETIKAFSKKEVPRIILALQFGVSDDAMNYRLKNLNISSR